MAVARPYGLEIDFVRNPISGSVVWFFVIILKFIFAAIFDIKVHVKKFRGTKKISLSKPDFQYKFDDDSLGVKKKVWIVSLFSYLENFYLKCVTVESWDQKGRHIWRFNLIRAPLNLDVLRLG